MKYVKKQIPVDAIQIPETPVSAALYDWICHAPVWVQIAYAEDDDEECGIWVTEQGLMVRTLEGDMLCPWGSYLIRGIRGEIYPCRRDIFEETYEVYEE